jgi:hypothetical protein
MAGKFLTGFSFCSIPDAEIPILIVKHDRFGELIVLNIFLPRCHAPAPGMSLSWHYSPIRTALWGESRSHSGSTLQYYLRLLKIWTCYLIRLRKIFRAFTEIGLLQGSFQSVFIEILTISRFPRLLPPGIRQ